ncbi:hypothetical protein [Marivivens aquimaris]|uniref:hypothetical protein n=1 Tax=Marivivens aquimaris TaxID=2774876 RepID=UPI00187F4E70|nr:hypothetical protein [Marivivens aquimaris]
MPQFILAYHGKPDVQSPEQGAELMRHWKVWQDGLGDAISGPSTPTGASKTLTPDGVVDGGGVNRLSGITILQADSIEDAIVRAKSNPHLSGTGTIEIAEAIELDM